MSDPTSALTERLAGAGALPVTDGEPWPYGPDAATQIIAAASWPWERVENREAWAPKMLADRDWLDREYARALRNLASAYRAALAEGKGGDRG